MRWHLRRFPADGVGFCCSTRAFVWISGACRGLICLSSVSVLLKRCHQPSPLQTVAAPASRRRSRRDRCPISRPVSFPSWTCPASDPVCPSPFSLRHPSAFICSPPPPLYTVVSLFCATIDPLRGQALQFVRPAFIRIPFRMSGFNGAASKLPPHANRVRS